MKKSSKHKVYHNNLVCWCGKPNTLVSVLGEKSTRVKCVKCGAEYDINTVIKEELIPVDYSPLRELVSRLYPKKHKRKR